MWNYVELRFVKKDTNVRLEKRGSNREAKL
jgi:hypothetical protein